MTEHQSEHETEHQSDETPAWYRKKRYALPSAVILTFAIIMITTGGNHSGIFGSVTSAAPPGSATRAAASPATAIMGKSVRDGTFAFVVTSVEQPTRTFTDRFGTLQKAQGMFVIVRVNVTNIGYEARTLTATNLYLVDVMDKRFGTSSAISSLAGAETIFYNTINPGGTVNDAPVLFDVEAGTEIASIELHDSMTSSGVRVRLS